MDTQENNTALSTIASILASVLLASAVGCGPPAPTDLPPPGQQQFVRDLAGMIQDADRAKIDEICKSAHVEKNIPIVVVTIRAMASHGGQGMSVRDFATGLFRQWRIGGDPGQPANAGILLLIAKNDRAADILLGPAWGNRKDMACQEIVEEHLLPYFRKDNPSGGILASVRLLGQMAHEFNPPAP